MATNFSKRISFDGKMTLVTIVQQLHKDGMYYEVNIKGYPRFYMKWSPLGRYDVTDEELQLPYNMVLAVSDAIEEQTRK